MGRDGGRAGGAAAVGAGGRGSAGMARSGVQRGFAAETPGRPRNVVPCVSCSTSPEHLSPVAYLPYLAPTPTFPPGYGAVQAAP